MNLKPEERDRYMRLGMEAELARIQALLNGTPVNGHAKPRRANWSAAARDKQAVHLKKIWATRKQSRAAAIAPPTSNGSDTMSMSRVKVIPLSHVPPDVNISHAILYALQARSLNVASVAETLLASPWKGTKSPRTSNHWRTLVSVTVQKLREQKLVTKSRKKIGAPWKITGAGLDFLKAAAKEK